MEEINKTDNVKDWKSLKTANFKSIEEICRMSYEFSMAYVIIGFPGAGKTNTFRIVKTYFDDVFYLKLDKTFRPKDLYIELLKILDVYDFDYSLSLKVLAERVIEELNHRSRRNLLIIDEANRLRHSFLTYFHQLIDDTTQTGLVISGTPEFEVEFKRWLKFSKPGIAELNSRIMEWRALERPTNHEIKSVAEKNGVKDKNELERLAKICGDYRKLYQEVVNIRIQQAKIKAAQTEVSFKTSSDDLVPA